jgi:hypothetical protein
VRSLQSSHGSTRREFHPRKRFPLHGIDYLSLVAWGNRTICRAAVGNNNPIQRLKRWPSRINLREKTQPVAAD